MLTESDWREGEKGRAQHPAQTVSTLTPESSPEAASPEHATQQLVLGAALNALGIAARQRLDVNERRGGMGRMVQRAGGGSRFVGWTVGRLLRTGPAVMVRSLKPVGRILSSLSLFAQRVSALAEADDPICYLPLAAGLGNFEAPVRPATTTELPPVRNLMWTARASAL